MCLCVLFVTYRVEMRALLCLCVFSVTVWFVCALVCDGVWCVSVRARVFLSCQCVSFSVLFEFVCAFCLGCFVR